MALTLKVMIFHILFFILFYPVSGKQDGKRLLLNDQDSINRIAKLEAQVHSLVETVSKLEQNLQTEKTQNAASRQTISTLEQNLQTEQIQNAAISQTMSESLKTLQDSGSSYVRWGKASCNSGSDMVYSGYMTGQIYSNDGSHFGGPSNFLCLPNNPELSNITVPGNSYLYGTEFEENTFGPKSGNEDVPCALCHSKNTTTSVMIPGRQTCYQGWNLEYRGRVASNYFNYRASSYVCVDLNPDYVPGGERNNDHSVLYTTGIKCGSIQCPPYHDNLEIFCVVCSK